MNTTHTKIDIPPKPPPPKTHISVWTLKIELLRYIYSICVNVNVLLSSWYIVMFRFAVLLYLIKIFTKLTLITGRSFPSTCTVTREWPLTVNALSSILTWVGITFIDIWKSYETIKQSWTPFFLTKLNITTDDYILYINPTDEVICKNLIITFNVKYLNF